MKWVFDIDTRKLTEAATGMVVSQVPLAYPDKYPVSISLVKSGAPHTLTGSAVFVLKTASRPQSQDLAFSEIAFVAGEASGVFNLNTNELNLVLAPSGSTQLTLDVSIVSGVTEVSSLTVSAPTTRRYYVKDSPGPTASLSTLATVEQAELGTNNTRWMSPLRVKQAIAAADVSAYATAAQGTKADSALQPADLNPYRTSANQDKLSIALSIAL